MEGAARIYAGELNRSAGVARHDGAVVHTPSGASCSRIYFVGVLTEVDQAGHGFLRARVADPTGTIDIAAGRDVPQVMEALSALTPPAFIALTGTFRIDTRLPEPHIAVRPEAVRVADRGERDQWLLVTADHTLRRLEAQHPADRDDRIAQAVERALAVIPETPEGESQAGVREAVMEIIDRHSGPRGMAVADVVRYVQEYGYPEPHIRDAIRDLLDDDECYTPASGCIRRL
jgi:RPA family protein